MYSQCFQVSTDQLNTFRSSLKSPFCSLLFVMVVALLFNRCTYGSWSSIYDYNGYRFVIDFELKQLLARTNCNSFVFSDLQRVTPLSPGGGGGGGGYFLVIG